MQACGRDAGFHPPLPRLRMPSFQTGRLEDCRPGPLLAAIPLGVLAAAYPEPLMAVGQALPYVYLYTAVATLAAGCVAAVASLVGLGLHVASERRRR